MIPSVRSVLLDRLESESCPGQRDDDHHVVLAVEGGGMRGAVSSGMLLALEQLGLRDSFDEVVGTSAGAIAGAFFVTKKGTTGSALYYTALNSPRFVDRRRLVRDGAILDLDYLIDEAFEQSGFVWQDLLDSDVPLFATVSPTDPENQTRSFPVGGSVSFAKSVLAASAALPVLSGFSREINGETYVDGGMLEAVPWQAAVERGATHVLVARSRGFNRNFEAEFPNIFERTTVPRLVRRMHGDHVAQLVEEAPHRFWRVTEHLRAVVEQRASAVVTGGRFEPVIEAVLPAPEDVLPDRLEVDRSVLMDALAAGARAMVDYLDIEGFTVEQRVVVSHPRAPVGTVRRSALVPIVRARRSDRR